MQNWIKIMIDYSFEAWLRDPSRVKAKKVMTWPKTHWHIIRDIWMDLEYEQRREIKSGDVVVDCGATVGGFTVKAALQAGETGQVYAFEPEPDNFSWLKKNTEQLSNVKICNKALWSEETTKYLWIVHGYRSGHSLGIRNCSLTERPDFEHTIKVKTTTIDKTVDGSVNFLKLDVEASELNVLHGASRILKTYHPFIAVEIHNEQIYDDVNQFLQHFGYDIIKRKGVEEFKYGTIYYE